MASGLGIPAAAPLLDSVRLFVESDLTEPEELALAGGVAVVFSARCPWSRKQNQDSAAVLPLAPGKAVLAVADGVGGHPGGARASRVAVETLEEALAGDALDGPESRAAILTGIEQANEAIRGAGSGAATTLMAAEVGGATLRSYHVGDSELLVVGQRGKVRHRTLSHSTVGYAVASGMLDEREALHHEERHVILNMLGAPDMRIELSSVLPLSPRDTVVLGTDGLFDNLHTDEIVEIVRKGPLGQVAATLARRCDRRMRTPGDGSPSKPDDLTFILFRQS